MPEEKALDIFTDGSSAPRPRTGGVGFRMLFPGGRQKDFAPAGYGGATNNEMELQAAVLALREVIKLGGVEGAQSVLIHSDSQYVVNNFNNAKFRWPKQKWSLSSGGPVLNATQWKELVRLSQRVWWKFRVPVGFIKVEGHSGHEHNNAAHNLAKHSRSNPYARVKLSTTNVRRRITTKQTVRGSIRGEGQRLRVRVITAGWLKEQKLFRSRCEVLSRKSKYYGNVDFLISEEALSAGHTYDVFLADDLKYCRVIKVFKEVKKTVQ